MRVPMSALRLSPRSPRRRRPLRLQSLVDQLTDRLRDARSPSPTYSTSLADKKPSPLTNAFHVLAVVDSDNKGESISIEILTHEPDNPSKVTYLFVILW